MNRNWNPHLLILLLLFFGSALVFDQSTPTFEASDEAWHYGVVREIASGRGMPVQQPGQITEFRQEGSQPPLYYYVSSLIIKWVDDYDSLDRYIYNTFGQVGIPGTQSNVNMFRHSNEEDFPWHGVTLAVRLIRWFSILLACGTIYYSYQIATLLYPKNNVIPILTGYFTAFNPMFLFISASVNNDNGIWFLSTVVIYFLLVKIQSSTNKLDSSSYFVSRLLNDNLFPWILGVLFGLAILTKLSALLLAPVLLLYLIYKAKYQSSVNQVVFDGMKILFCIITVSGWWFYRNWILYDEFFGFDTMLSLYGYARVEPITLSGFFSELQGWWFSFWGVFGAFNILPEKWFFVGVNTLFLISIGGFIRLLLQREKITNPLIEQYFVHYLAWLFLFVTLVGNVYWSINQHAAQGRLAIIALPVISTYLAAGIVFMAGRSLQKYVYYLFIIVMPCVSLFVSIFYIASRYEKPKPIKQDDLPDNVMMVNSVYNDEIELLGYSVNDDTMYVGSSLEVTLYWRGKIDISDDYNLSLNLYGRNMENIGKLDTWPGRGLLPTGDWQPDVIYPDNYIIPITVDATTPTIVKLGASFWDDNVDNILPISQYNAPIDSVMLDVGKLLPIDQSNSVPDITYRSVFESDIVMLGYSINKSTTLDLSLDIYWQAMGKIHQDLTVFVHLLDDFNNVIFQVDGPPVNGYWPTSAWATENIVVDSRRIQLPKSSDYDIHTIAVGLYDPVSGRRIPVYRQDGTEYDDWQVRIDVSNILSSLSTNND